MAIYTHGWESDPRRDGCDSCQDLRNEIDGWRRSFKELSARYLVLEAELAALHGSCPEPDTSAPAHTPP